MGDTQVQAVELHSKDTKRRCTPRVDAVLVRVGHTPNTEFLAGQVDLDSHGYIRVSSGRETSRPDVFAIGDVANPLVPTISTGVGDAAVVAKQIWVRLSA
jgi:thioredoxin reductase (NADPH)